MQSAPNSATDTRVQNGRRSHYDVLGVRADASASTIKAAYRRRMRELHPDSSARPVNHDEISSVSAAWKVLSNSKRRGAYDATLRRTESTYETTHPYVSSNGPVFNVDATPARYPWKFVLILGAIGITAVLLVAAFSKPAEPSKPDNVLQAGSCVDIATDGTVGEVSCAGPHSGTVKFLVAFDAVCPSDTEPHLDRQGMGRACVVRTADPVASGG